MAAITQIAINRMRRWGLKDIKTVFSASSSKGKWNTHPKWRENYNNAHKYFHLSKAVSARKLIESILKSGSTVGDLGGAIGMLHLKGMGRCNLSHKTKMPKGGKMWICYDFKKPYGKRRVPAWAVHTS